MKSARPVLKRKLDQDEDVKIKNELQFPLAFLTQEEKKEFKYVDEQQVFEISSLFGKFPQLTCAYARNAVILKLTPDKSGRIYWDEDYLEQRQKWILLWINAEKWYETSRVVQKVIQKTRENSFLRTVFNPPGALVLGDLNSKRMIEDYLPLHEFEKVYADVYFSSQIQVLREMENNYLKIFFKLLVQKSATRRNEFNFEKRLGEEIEKRQETKRWLKQIPKINQKDAVACHKTFKSFLKSNLLSFYSETLESWESEEESTDELEEENVEKEEEQGNETEAQTEFNFLSEIKKEKKIQMRGGRKLLNGANYRSNYAIQDNQEVHDQLINEPTLPFHADGDDCWAVVNKIHLAQDLVRYGLIHEMISRAPQKMAYHRVHFCSSEIDY